MGRPQTVIEKVGAWDTAFSAIRESLTPPITRQVLAEMQGVTDIGSLQAAERLARIVSANDRTAAIVAAMLTSSGIQRPVIEFDDGSAS